MDWKKSKLTIWQAVGYRITEDPDSSFGRPFRLESPGASPECFEELEDAKRTAAIKNELAITKAENERLRAELTRVQNHGSWERHPAPEDFEEPAAEVPAVAVALALAETAKQPPNDYLARQQAAADAYADRDEAEPDDGRGIPAAPHESPDVAVTRAGQILVTTRKGPVPNWGAEFDGPTKASR